MERKSSARRLLWRAVDAGLRRAPSGTPGEWLMRQTFSLFPGGSVRHQEPAQAREREKGGPFADRISVAWQDPPDVKVPVVVRQAHENQSQGLLCGASARTRNTGYGQSNRTAKNLSDSSGQGLRCLSAYRAMAVEHFFRH